MLSRLPVRSDRLSGGEGHPKEDLAVAGQGLDEAAGLRVPDLGRLVAAARRDVAPVGRHRHLLDEAGVARELVEDGPRPCVRDEPIGAGACHEAESIGKEPHRRARHLHRPVDRAARDIKDVHPVAVADVELAAIRREDGVAAGLGRCELLTRCDVQMDSPSSALTTNFEPSGENCVVALKVPFTSYWRTSVPSAMFHSRAIPSRANVITWLPSGETSSVSTCRPLGSHA